MTKIDSDAHDPLDFEDIPPEPPSMAGTTGNANLDALKNVLDALGFPYTEEPGWLTRDPDYNWYSGEDYGTSENGPFGVMIHHTATESYDPKSAYPEPEGYRTDGKVICNILIQPDGVINFVSADPANYSSGLNQRALLTDYVLPKVRFYGPQSGDLGPEWYGNRAWINIETVHPGLGEPIPEVQEEAVIAVTAIMCAIKGWDSTAVIGHYDGRGTKPDPEWEGIYSDPPYSIAGIQDAVQALLDSGELPSPPPYTPPPDEEDFDMPTLHEGDGFFDGPHPEYRSAVKAMQIMLAHHDYFDMSTADDTCAADGAFGSGSLQALKAFQAAKGLVVDGICGPKSWEALNEPRS